MNIFNQLKQDIIKAGEIINANAEVLNKASIEIPKNILNGDLSSNIAMLVAARDKSNPKEIAFKFKEELLKISYIAHIEIAGPGFLNFTIRAEKWHEAIGNILKDSVKYSKVAIGDGKKVNIEYVSVNPTGPLHIGHARGAVYGDCLANILSKCGFDITREYYFNDAGAQITSLTETVWLRYKSVLNKEEIVIPEGLYPGEYLIPVAQKLIDIYQDNLLKLPTEERVKIIKDHSITEMLSLAKDDLKDLGVNHEVFTSEQSLHNSGKTNQAIDQLKKLGLIYEGDLPPPKGKEDTSWESRSQLLFKSTNYGDDMDRPLQKADGSWTYLAADVAYAKDKIDRGFKHLIIVLGADHIGYVKRLEAIPKALSDGDVSCEVKICQLVNFVEDNIPIKMSKRKGGFTTVRDVVNEVGVDVIRFMMLTQKNDAVINFDLTKVKEQSKDNPVFYVQYAYVRTLSIINNCKELLPESYNDFINNDYDLSLLASEEEIQLVKYLAFWPKLLESSAITCEPHKIVSYLINLASKFHSLWNLGKENNNYRFIINDDSKLTTARLALSSAVQKMIEQGLTTVGVKPMKKM